MKIIKVHNCAECPYVGMITRPQQKCMCAPSVNYGQVIDDIFDTPEWCPLDTADNAELLAALEKVDEHLKHVPDYEYGWINHPEKPERSLADMVRGLIAKAKPAEA
jgi:hypothetical protein